MKLILLYIFYLIVAIGTLRYMGARLRGLDQGRRKEDPLRVELDKIRACIKMLKKLESNNNAKSKEATTVENETTKENDCRKRRKILDASERMVEGALG
jgi:hypothetical protein